MTGKVCHLDKVKYITNPECDGLSPPSGEWMPNNRSILSTDSVILISLWMQACNRTPNVTLPFQFY